MLRTYYWWVKPVVGLYLGMAHRVKVFIDNNLFFPPYLVFCQLHFNGVPTCLKLLIRDKCKSGAH